MGGDYRVLRRELYDSEFFDPSERFAHFRETCEKSFHPLQVECSPKVEFKTRTEVVSLTTGHFSRSRCAPLEFVRTSRHVRNSQDRYIYGTLILSGGLEVEQGDRRFTVNPGQLLIADSITPSAAKCMQSQQLSFAVSESEFAFLGQDLERLYDSLPWCGRPPRHLSKMLEFVAKNMAFSSDAEFHALFHATMSYLPLTTGSLGRLRLDGFDHAKPIMQRIESFINANLSLPSLSAISASDDTGVTDRYVHKLFAAQGTTFSTYVTDCRIHQVCVELSSARRRSISSIAYAWGFNDISTFNREFKKRLGCTPTNYRAAQNGVRHPE